MKQYKRNLSKDLRNELKRLEESKNSKLRQRYDLIQNGILRVLVNPKNTDNIPNDLKPYWVEKVGGQIRLFYEIIDGIDVIHFVWVNSEDFPHDTNNGQANDPCYNEFTRLYRNQSLEKYTPEKIIEGKYEQKQQWLSEQVYATYSEASAFSNCTMTLEVVGERAYSILALYSNSLELNLESKLIAKLIESSKSYKISFSYDLYLGSADENAIRTAFKENGFKCEAIDDGVERWFYDV